MTPTSTVEASTSLLAQLIDPATRALVLGCAAGLGLAAFRVKTTSLRLFTWRAVLYAALAIPLLGWLLPPLAVPTPAFFQNGVAQRVPAAAPVSSRLTSALVPSAPDQVAARDDAAVPSSLLSSIRWSVVAAGIYLAIALFLLVRFFVGLALGRRLVKASRIVVEPRVVARLSSFARARDLALFLELANRNSFLCRSRWAQSAPQFFCPPDGVNGMTRSSTLSSPTRCRTLRGATLSSRVCRFCTARSSGSARSPGGSTGISQTSRNKPATKRHCLAAPTVRITPGLYSDFSKTCRPRPEGCGGRALRWPRQARRNNEWKEFLRGKDRLP